MRTDPLSRPAARVADTVLTAALAACLVAGLSACSASESGSDPSADATAASGSPSGPSASPSPSDSSDAPQTAATTPTPTPSATAPEPTPSPGPTAPGLRGRLLAADQVPGLEAGSPWSAAGVSRVESDPVAVCHKTPLGSIGAQQVVVRTFTDAADPAAYAAHLVGRFADRATAQRTLSVLTSWHDDCADRLAAGGAVGPDATVGVIRTVVAEGAATSEAQWYLTRGASGSGSFEVTGLAAQGNRIAVLVVGSDAPAAGSAPDEDSVDRAVGLAAQLLR